MTKEQLDKIIIQQAIVIASDEGIHYNSCSHDTQIAYLKMAVDKVYKASVEAGFIKEAVV